MQTSLWATRITSCKYIKVKCSVLSIARWMSPNGLVIMPKSVRLWLILISSVMFLFVDSHLCWKICYVCTHLHYEMLILKHRDVVYTTPCFAISLSPLLFAVCHHNRHDRLGQPTCHEYWPLTISDHSDNLERTPKHSQN